MEKKTPQTNKAMQTKQRLMEATFDQIAKYGYHNVTADKIAAAAGVSTGSAYRYFKNKKEMLLAAIDYYYSNIQAFSGTEDEKLTSFSSFEEMMGFALDQFYAIHKKYYGMHEELESLRHIDPEIKEAYDRILLDAIDKLIKKCPHNLSNLSDVRERIYLGVQLMETFTHTKVETEFAKEFDMDAMQAIAVDMVKKLLPIDVKEEKR